MHQRIFLFHLLALLVFAPSTAVGVADVPVYGVAVSDDLRSLKVTACFPGEAPRALFSMDDRADPYPRDVVTAGPGEARHLARQGGRIALDELGRGACVSYRVATGDVARSRGGLSVKVRNTLLLSPLLFLWYPSEGSSDLEVRFELPADLKVSAPWRRAGGTAQRPVFRTGLRPATWDAKIALGKFRTEQIRVAGGTLEVALLDGDPPVDADRILRWLRAQTAAVAKAYGRFPVPRAQVLVVPLGGGGEPVPWGQVTRGGGDAVHLYVDQSQDETAFMEDWVLVHELSHLLHPPIEGDGRWLYEGLASYYQNVLRARQGLIPAATAWEKLHAGFRRGMKGTRPSQTLARASEAMLRERAFMRVYWSGAAIALLSDLELRRVSGGRQSLDSVLSDLQRCCLPSDRLWGEREVIDKLDALSGTRIFSRLYDRYIDNDAFPDLRAAYSSLGLQPEDDETLHLVGGRAAADLRKGIMGGE